MNKLTLRYKFLAFGSVLGLLLIGQMGLIFAYTSSASDAMKHFAVVETPILNKAHELKLAVVQVQQWLTDISATRGQDGLGDGFEEAERSARRFGALLQELRGLDSTNAQRYRAMEPAFAAYYETGQRMARAYVEQGPAGGNKLMAEFDETAEKLAEQVDSFLADARQRVELASADQVSALGRLKWIVPLGASVVIIVLLVVGVLVRSILRSLMSAIRISERIAIGDLTTHIEVRSKDEIGQLNAPGPRPSRLSRPRRRPLGPPPTKPGMARRIGKNFESVGRWVTAYGLTYKSSGSAYRLCIGFIFLR